MTYLRFERLEQEKYNQYQFIFLFIASRWAASCFHNTRNALILDENDKNYKIDIYANRLCFSKPGGYPQAIEPRHSITARALVDTESNTLSAKQRSP